MRRFVICTPRQILSERSIKKSDIDKACSTDGVWGEVYTGFWWGCQRVRDHLEGPDVGRRIILKLIYKNN